MTVFEEFSSLVCCILLSVVLWFMIKINRITVENQEPQEGTNQPQQPVVYGSFGRRCITTRIDGENQNHNIQDNRQVPREHDERQGY